MAPSFYRDRGYSPELVEFLMASHTAPVDVGQIADQAGVKTVVLSLLGPPDSEDVADADWHRAVATHFAGRIVIGNNLLRVCPQGS